MMAEQSKLDGVRYRRLSLSESGESRRFFRGAKGDYGETND